MRKMFLAMMICPVVGLAQVGIGTSSPNASAKLQVDDPNRGFLPPRVALQGTDDATKSTPTIASPITGLLVYNTATAATGTTTAVTPGFYYYDGSKWQRIINQQPDATVSFNTANPNTGGPTFDPPDRAASKDYIYVSSVDNTQWTYNGSTYVTYTPPASTPWLLSSGTSDAGSNKTASIYRSGKVGIGGNTTPNATLDIRTNPTSTTDPGAGFLGVGTGTATAAQAGAGAVRYNTGSGGFLEFSNGSAWTKFAAPKAVVTGRFTSMTGSVLNCTELSDQSNVFASNEFTAPRDGFYMVTAMVASEVRSWSAQTQFTLAFSSNSSAAPSTFARVMTSGIQTLSASSINVFLSTSISGVVYLTSGQKGRFELCCETFTLLSSTAFQYFSINEL